ncbi:MAG: hypothetical protein HUJ65_02100, partial [Oscillospiraceae bacterium]|nr:hypothetical protein [Oscillospiraceae bacterium]
MKNLSLLLISILALALTACEQGAKQEKIKDMAISDSLQHLLDLRDAEINDLLTIFNDVQESFNEINEAEDRIALIRAGEGSNSKETIRENFAFIKDKMKQNKQMIEDLQQQLRESTFKGEELKRTLNGLIAQMSEKDKRLTELSKLLEEKEQTIATQAEKLTAQTEQITTQENTISEQNAN